MGGVFLVTFSDRVEAGAAVRSLERRGYAVEAREESLFEISSEGRSLLARVYSEPADPEAIVFLTSASLNPVRLWKDRTLFEEVHDVLAGEADSD